MCATITPVASVPSVASEPSVAAAALAPFLPPFLARLLSPLRLALLAGVLVMPGLAGCAPGESGTAGPEREWTVSAAPLVRIGVVDGEEAYQFHRIAGVVTLRDGRIAVGNAGSGEIRFFDAEGRHLSSAGAPGDGPGEFGQLASLSRMPGDSLLAFDNALQRVSVFDSAGGFVRSWAPAPQGRGLYPTGAHAAEDGSVLVVHLRGHMPGDPGGIIRNSGPVVRFSSEGEALNVVAELPGEEWYRSEALGTLTVLPFGRKGHVALHRDLLFLGDSDTPVVTVLGLDGEVVRTLGAEAPAERVTPHHARRFREAVFARSPDPEAREGQEALHAELPLPTTFPAYAQLRVDAEGNLWLEAYRYLPEMRSLWSVFGADGALAARIELPPELRVFQVSDDTLLGVSQDALGVEYVELYSISR